MKIQAVTRKTISFVLMLVLMVSVVAPINVMASGAETITLQSGVTYEFFNTSNTAQSIRFDGSQDVIFDFILYRANDTDVRFEGDWALHPSSAHPTTIASGGRLLINVGRREPLTVTFNTDNIRIDTLPRQVLYRQAIGSSGSVVVTNHSTDRTTNIHVRRASGNITRMTSNPGTVHTFSNEVSRERSANPERFDEYIEVLGDFIVFSGQWLHLPPETTPQQPQQPETPTVTTPSETQTPAFIGDLTLSPWAQMSVGEAITTGLVPQNLQGNYTQATTRAEFAAFAVALYETATGQTITGRANFNDTSDINVQKMGYLGVVTGVGGGNFNPNGQLTREQAAVMLVRLAEVIGQPLPSGHSNFADGNQISSWAINAVADIQTAGIMGGVGDNRFAPQGDYTREQSIVTMLRLFELLN